jgi:hypothetical protein
MNRVITICAAQTSLRLSDLDFIQVVTVVEVTEEMMRMSITCFHEVSA